MTPALSILVPSSLGVLLVLALVVAILPAVAVLRAPRMRRPDGPGEQQKHARYALTLVTLWCTAFLAAYALRLHGIALDAIGLRPVRAVGDVALGLAVPVALLGLGLFRRDLSQTQKDVLRKIVPARTGDWVWFVALSATAGVCEEFLYRGFALTQVAALAHAVTAGVVVSTLAFGIAHAYQGRAGVIGAALSGLLYALVFLRTGSLVPCMLGHFAQDILGGVFLSRRLAEE